jgi:large subunit ribosomal protein L22
MAEKDTAVANGMSLPISTKQSIEICNFIRGRPLAKAKLLLAETIAKKRAIPFKRFNADTGHKKGIGAGKYPEKACKEILKLLNAVEANAQFKGLSTGDLVISELVPNRASTPWHYGRQRRRKMKRTNIKVVVKEMAVKKKEAPKTAEKKQEKQKKAEVKKPEVKKVEGKAPKKIASNFQGSTQGVKP